MAVVAVVVGVVEGIAEVPAGTTGIVAVDAPVSLA